MTELDANSAVRNERKLANSDGIYRDWFPIHERTGDYGTEDKKRQTTPNINQYIKGARYEVRKIIQRYHDYLNLFFQI